MPICVECKQSFPTRKRLGNKIVSLHNRKYCLDCSPYGKRIKCGPKPKSISILEKKCIKCGKTNKAKKNLVCNTCRSFESRTKNKLKAIEIKGGQCQKCGYNKSRKALVFHHRDPSTKHFTIAWAWHLSWQKIQEEIEKCDLLCSNCHIELHEDLQNKRV